MKKNKFALALISVTLLLIGTADVQNTSQTVTAATQGYVKVKTKKKVRLYWVSGKHSNYYALPNHKYSYSSKSRIGKRHASAYKIGNNAHWILAKDVKTVKKAKAVTYVKAQMVLPRGYNRAELLKAYEGHPSKAFVAASMQGMKTNTFSRNHLAESKADNQTEVDLDNITPEQLTTLSDFSLRLINEARNNLGLKAWVDSAGTQKLAQAIATEYEQNGRTIKDGHYVPGIVRACQANGLNLNDNYVEDMAGFYNQKQTLSMTELKKSIYFGIKQMIFGYVGSGESDRGKRSNYQEWEHAGDLFNTQGSLHDGDYNYFGFSVSRTDDICSLHFISVPTYVVKDQKYNLSFKP
ncbi:SEC10/PgrA surface exclusion domain-containing protein [Lactobacillus sp. ESL0731]|uniref:SEC10/PgrA surface exclusion domain-containing protein n=1 Tax=unclassified Lactobacillus TaxID=2620435 RepID=UPI0023F6F388|nr:MULTISPECIES: SEC10/PgrA surface exclusion domain-containing protein [unclassified Lactobacillus]WEV51468.1 SEC10/PgrA surface exclusion domain-containing protein [Lactobacillus sp. ESL0700]WEV62597.1 SEC10/PgrA surface exclusion domain-containing protein [Lactobacillus sp. ESL0731]